MSLDELIQYLRLRDFHLCGTNDEKQQAALSWSIDSAIVVVVFWNAESNCFAWRLASHFMSRKNCFITPKPLLLEQDIWIDRMFDALNEQIDHLYKWLFPAHTEDF